MSSSRPATPPMPSASCRCSIATCPLGQGAAVDRRRWRLCQPRQPDRGQGPRRRRCRLPQEVRHRRRRHGQEPWVYRRLRNFRAGIEAGISCFKRAYGAARCTWRGRWCGWGDAGAFSRGSSQLRQYGIEKIIVAGIVANTCIEATTRCADELGYQVTLVRAATAAHIAEEAGLGTVGLP